MNQTGNERELELVSRYLEEHFNPIRGLVNGKVVDPEARELALRRCTKHIFPSIENGVTRDLHDRCDAFIHLPSVKGSPAPGRPDPSPGVGWTVPSWRSMEAAC